MRRFPVIFCLLALVAASSCVKDDYDYKAEIEALKTQLANQKAMIEVLQQAVTVTDIQKGTDSFTITFSNGDSYTITNGYTPVMTIGENGNWFINGQDSGQPSKGKDGRDGTDVTVEIGSNGCWYINGVNTGVKAAGRDGRDGTDAPYITAIVEDYTSLEFLFSDGSSIPVYKQSYDFLSSERASYVIYPTGSIQLSSNYIRPNTLMSAAMSFSSFSKLEMGRGFDEQGGWKLEITSTEVTVKKYGTSSYSTEKTVAHGLTIADALYVTIDAGWDGATISLYSSGKEFRTDSGWNAGGTPFIYNTGSAAVDADLSFFPYDAGKTFWLIGDENAEGWTARLHSDGISPLADIRPGATAYQMFQSFKNDLKFSNPSFAVWAPYSGDKSDDGAVDSSWKSATEKFLELCELRGITPVLVTVPSGAGKDHSYKSAWVKESGFRYVDLASAAPDAEAMAYRILVDLPEISQCR